jgi:hypothetical protein
MARREDLTYQEELLIELIDEVTAIRGYLKWFVALSILWIIGAVAALLAAMS